MTQMKARLAVLFARYFSVARSESDSGEPLFRFWHRRPERRARAARSGAASMALGLTATFFLCGAAFLLVSAPQLPLSFRLLAISLAGMLAFSLGDLILQLDRARQAALQERMWALVDVNHHVRNAMQVILYHKASESGAELPDPVREAIRRIDSVLREKLEQGALPSLAGPPYFVVRMRSEDRAPQGIVGTEFHRARTSL